MSGDLRPVVGVLGYGVDGQCVAEFLSLREEVERVMVFDDTFNRQGFGEQEVTIQSDSCRCVSRRINSPANASTQSTHSVVVCSSKVQRGQSLEHVALLFRSPGFPLTHPLVLEAKERGIPITSSTRYFLEHCPAITVGITGSNGKTTCTALVFRMLRCEFGEERVYEGGNDRVPRLDLLHQLKEDDIVVLELSSFQLIDCPVSPRVAVVLNITPNHLNWHQTMEEYIEAKRQIVSHSPSPRQAVANQQVAILNQHDSIVKSFAEGLRSEVRWFDENIDLSRVRCKTHGDTVRAAVTAARELGVSAVNIGKILETFPGVPHRLEFVREIDGIKYYNDSSCTTPESAITACEAFPEGSLAMLIGGRDKGMDFSRLYEVIKERDIAVVPYGEMADAFQKNIPKSYKLTPHASFEEAIHTARSTGRPNVVLSPACASFDMFENAKERGAEFQRIVLSL